MEKVIHRKVVLSVEEVRRALYWYLKRELNLPMPESDEELTVVSDGGKTAVSWQELSIVEVPLP